MSVQVLMSLVTLNFKVKSVFFQIFLDNKVTKYVFSVKCVMLLLLLILLLTKT